MHYRLYYTPYACVHDFLTYTCLTTVVYHSSIQHEGEDNLFGDVPGEYVTCVITGVKVSCLRYDK
jgi:hypothetical protein